MKQVFTGGHLFDVNGEDDLEQGFEEEGNISDVDDEVPPNTQSSQQLEVRLAAQFLLGLETKHRISRNGVQGVWEGFLSIVENMHDNFRQGVQSKFGHLSEQFQGEVADLFSNPMHNYSELSSDYRRHEFYKRHFNFVAPVEIVLQPDQRRPSYGYFVPLKPLLQLIFSLPEMRSRLNTMEARRRDGIMTDFSDGSYCRHHKFAGEESFVQILLSYDDLEQQNPLRSNKKSKMAMFYLSLGNIKACYRSKLNSIFLLAVARSKDIKGGGLELLLSDFVKNVNALSTTGLPMEIGGREINVKGDLISVLCDTPAAALIGGFKESVQAYKLCRMCHANKDSYTTTFREEDFQMRSMQSYIEECKIISAARPGVIRSHFSKAFGINKLSVLAQIDDFPVTGNILQDPMHCLLEGAFAQCLAMFLQRICLEDKLFTLADLNSFLENFAYSYIDRANKPHAIERIHVTNGSIKQKAATILMLSYLLPFFFARYTTELDRHYEHYLTLTKIVHIAFCPLTDETTAVLLGNLIEEYCKDLELLYPHDSVKPKCHFLIHFPSAIREFGPLKNMSTMRFEGKHGFFKTQKLFNFRNVPKTMAMRHQLNLAYLVTKSDGELTDCFFDEGDNVAEGSVLSMDNLNPNLREALLAAARFQGDEENIYISPKVTRNGLELRPGIALCTEDNEFTGPAFALLKLIAFAREDIFLCMQNLHIVEFSKALNAYEVELQATFITKLWKPQHNYWPLPLVLESGRFYITHRHSLYPIY
jgi:hypothetical protein